MFDRKLHEKHVLLPEVGAQGQEKLSQSSVLVVGLGGLGSPVVTYLASAGVGRLGLVDDDYVELSNLPRQPIHVKSVDLRKVSSARNRARDINPSISIAEYPLRMNADNVAMFFGEAWDVVVDATDNVETRLILNDQCFKENVPLVHGAIYGYEGQVKVFARPGPCYRCFYREPIDKKPKKSGGVLNVVPGVIGLIQATEVLKLLLNLGNSLTGDRILVYDAKSMRFTDLALERNPNCPTCGKYNGK